MGVISNRDREIQAWFKRKTITITGLFEDRQFGEETNSHMLQAQGFPHTPGKLNLYFRVSLSQYCLTLDASSFA
jgi:hypothetical protein